MALQCGRCNGYESDDLAKQVQISGTRQPGAALSAEFRRCSSLCRLRGSPLVERVRGLIPYRQAHEVGSWPGWAR
jgi:hypothetical protein